MRHLRRAPLALVLALCVGGCAPRPTFSLIVRGGTVISGDGSDGRVADVGIAGDRIVAVGSLPTDSAPVVIDATGKLVTPGFVDLQGPSAQTTLLEPYAETALRQGITTQLFGVGNPAYWSAQTDAERQRCLGGPIDWQGLDGYLARLQTRGPAFNVAVLTPVAAAKAAGGDVAAFIDGELQKGAFGAAAAPTDAPADVAAAAVPVKRATGLLELPWHVLAANDPAWLSIVPQAGRVLVSRSWASPAALPSAVYNLSLPQGSLIFSAIVPQTVIDATTFGYGTRLGSGFVFTSASETDGCADPTSAVAQTRGAFPYLLARLVRERGMTKLSNAIAHASLLAAKQAGVYRRGLLEKDYFADLLVIDPQRVADQPSGPPIGIDYVVVNGVVTVAPQGLTGARAGYALRHRPGEPI